MFAVGYGGAIMLDYESPEIPFREALRRFGKVIEFYETMDIGG